MSPKDSKSFPQIKSPQPSNGSQAKSRQLKVLLSKSPNESWDEFKTRVKENLRLVRMLPSQKQ
jgi:hypothetical protein